MNILKKGTVIVFLAMALLTGALLITDMADTDRTRPQITFDQERLYVEAAAGEPDLMQGVRAYDEKDGDLTARVIVESVSDEIEPGTVRVRYAVYDNDGHAAEASRLLTYNGYAAPRFSLSEDLVFDTNETVNVLGKLTAVDAIRGDVSADIRVSSEDLEAGVEGEYTVTVQAPGSLGDMARIDLPVSIERCEVLAPAIRLSDYLVYLKTGDAFDARSYISEVTGGIPAENVQIESGVNTAAPGVFRVDYRVQDGMGCTGHTVLNVVVEERGEN